MPPILDQFGGNARSRYPRTFQGIYDTPANRPGDSRPRPILRPLTFQNITSWQRWELTNYSRVIRAGIPNIDAALEMKANFAFGGACHIKSKSTTTGWGSLMEGHINEEFYPDCNILGPEHDFHTTMTELSAAMDCDGGYACVFDDVTGKIRVIPNTLIGNGWGINDGSAKGDVSALGKGWNDFGMWGLAAGGWGGYGGIMFGYMIISDPASPFNGARIIDGMIVDRNMVRIGVRVLGFNEDGKMAYKDIPAANIHVNFGSKWSDQIGFIPTLAPAIMAITNVQDFDYYIKQAMILSAAWAVTRKTKDGSPRPVGGTAYSEVDEDGCQDQKKRKPSRVHQFEDVGAGILELSTDNEEAVEALKFERPSMNEEAFVERVERGYLAKHWPYDLFYGKEMGRAYIRAVGRQVIQIVHNAQRHGARTMRWMINRRIAWAMKNGRLPSNNAAADPYAYIINWPAQFTTDEGNDRQADRDDLKMGLTTRAHVIGKSGGNPEHFEQIRFDEEDRTASMAEKLAQKHTFMDAAGWMERLDQRSPNPLQLPPEKKQDPDADTQAAEEDKTGMPAKPAKK